MRFKRFRPMRMDNVSISTKLWVLVGVLALPIVVLMGTQFISLQDSVDRAEKARAGVEFETKGLELVRDFQLHRDHEMRVLRGNTASRGSLDGTAAAIDANLTELRDLAGAAGVRDEVVRLEVDWNAFKSTERKNAVESFGAHTTFISEHAVPVLLTAATRTELFTDGDLASRSVIQALFTTLNMGEQVAQARALSNLSSLERSGEPPTGAERDAMAEYVITAGVYAADLKFQLGLAMAADPALAGKLAPLMEKQEQSFLTFAGFVDDNFVNANILETARAESFYVLGTGAVTASNDLVTVAANEMNSEFDDRSAAAMREMQVVGGVAVVGIAAALVLAFWVSRSITRPVSHLAEVADRISLGELDVDIDVHGTNEVGQLAESLRRMQASLRSAIERLRQRRAA
ncbi:MAG: HAMP domain-containing protein [Dehalococcoidia bacterium]